MTDWIAFVQSTELPLANSPTKPRAQPTYPKQTNVGPINIHHHSTLAIHHWEHAEWSIALLGTGSIREDFLDTWLSDPTRAINTCSDGFILIAFDKKHNRCWLVRDSLGFQNAYWGRQEDRLCVASSLQLLNRQWTARPELAMEHVSEYLSFRYTHAPRTLFKDRYSLIAGHITIIDPHKVHVERWYRPQWYEMGQNIPSEKEALLEVDYLLRRSLEPDLFSGSKMGVLLSGGLDSSAILYHAHQLGYSLDSFTVMIEGVDSDESPFAGRIAHLYNSPNHLLRLGSTEIIEALRKSVDVFDLPLSTPAAVVQQLLCEASLQYVDRLFTGDGGDEVFGGRSMPIIAREMRRSKMIHRLPKMSQLGLHRVAKRMGKGAWFTDLNQFGLEEEIGGSKVFSATERATLLQDPAYIRPNIRKQTLTNFYQEIDSDPLNDILYVWQRGWLVEDSLHRIRTLSPTMAIPMLNRELREYCARLPSHYKVRSQGLEFYGKWLMRENMKKRMPKRLLSRPKRTLMAPLDQWLRKDGRNFLAQTITEMTRFEEHIFQPNRLHALYREHTNGDKNHGLKLWTLLLFHLWYKRHIRGK